MRNGFYGCNEHSHSRTYEVVSTEHFKRADNVSNAFSLILFHWLTRGWFLLGTSPLSVDPINIQRQWERLTNSRTCQCAKECQDERQQNSNFKISLRAKEPGCKINYLQTTPTF